MGSANETIRRRLGWAVVLVALGGVAGWFGYRAYASSHREEVRQREDAENLRRIRYWSALEDLLLIGNAGDETARKNCRHALFMLKLLEPDWYQSWMPTHAPDQGWVYEPTDEKP